MTKEEQLDWLCRLRSEIIVYMPKEWLIPMNNALDMTIKALEQELKTGHWIDVESLDSALWHSCSECGKLEFYATNYCPNCGAKMEKEE